MRVCLRLSGVRILLALGLLALPPVTCHHITPTVHQDNHRQPCPGLPRLEIFQQLKILNQKLPNPNLYPSIVPGLESAAKVSLISYESTGSNVYRFSQKYQRPSLEACQTPQPTPQSKPLLAVFISSPRPTALHPPNTTQTARQKTKPHEHLIPLSC